MFDNLREENSSLFDDDDNNLLPEDNSEIPEDLPRGSSSRFLGMTPMQRFIIAAMLMIAICILGTMCLLLTGKFGVPY